MMTDIFAIHLPESTILERVKGESNTRLLCLSILRALNQHRLTLEFQRFNT